MTSKPFRKTRVFRFLRTGIPAVIRPIWPGIAVLAATMLIAGFGGEFTFTSGGPAFGYAFSRFFRLTVNLILPLFLLPVLCGSAEYFLNRGEGRLIRINPDDGKPFFNPLRAWAVRPLQGIGLLMLMATHFSTPLAKYLGGVFTGVGAPAALPPGELTLGRFINVGVTSLLLIFVWTMEDLGIRRINRKKLEMRRVAKYLGSVVPVLTGFYGVYSLFKDEPASRAIFYLIQRMVIFYPPLVVLGVLHGEYVRRRREDLLHRLKAETVDLRFPF